MNKKIIIKGKYQAIYENAKDCLYYGFGYKFWKKNNCPELDDDIAINIWDKAVEEMCR